jgi:hypothetical protein
MTQERKDTSVKSAKDTKKDDVKTKEKKEKVLPPSKVGTLSEHWLATPCSLCTVVT